MYTIYKLGLFIGILVLVKPGKSLEGNERQVTQMNIKNICETQINKFGINKPYENLVCA